MKSISIFRTKSKISVGNAAVLIIGVTLLGQALGFLRTRLISTNITTLDPGASDAFFAAFQIPDFFYYTISAGVLGVAFIPFLSDRLAVNDKKGVWELTSSILNVLAIFMFFICLSIFIFAQPLIQLLAPNLPPDHMAEAVTIMRFIAFNPLLFTIGGIVASVQQTFGRFFFFAIAPLFYNLAIIISIFVFKDSLGVEGLGLGAFLGSVAQLLVLLIGMVGLGFSYKPIIKWKNQNFRAMLRQLPPRSLDQGIDQVNSIVEVNRAQALGTGPVSYYNFALTLQNVPIMLLGNSIAIAAFPRLTERLSQGRPDLFRRDFIKVLSAMIWIALPVLVVSYFARGYLARLIFGANAPEVALIFGFLTASIFFRIVYSMLSRYFYAYKDTTTPLIVSVFAIGLNIYLAFALAHQESYGITGLALAQSITAAIEVAILTIIIIWRDRKLFTMQFVDTLTRMASATGFAIVAAFATISYIPLQVDDRGFITLGTKLLAITAITGGVYLVVSWLLKLREVQPVFAKAKSIILKPIKMQ